MSDLELRVKETLVKTISEVMMEWTLDDIADEWVDLIGCVACPYNNKCKVSDELCSDLIIKHATEDIMSKEES